MRQEARRQVVVVTCRSRYGLVQAVAVSSAPYYLLPDMIRHIQRQVGALNPDTEWSGYTYTEMPYWTPEPPYFEYVSPDTLCGVYLTRWEDPDQWARPVRRAPRDRVRLCCPREFVVRPR